MVFAIIGDYGSGDSHERAVAELVASWQPSFILTAGDDYYAPAGGAGTGRYDASTGAFYCQWLRDIAAGPDCAGGAPRNAFFPALGNHDYSDATPSPDTYLAYFTLPGDGFTSSSGNERYYDFVQGDVHFYVVNSNPDEPDGTSATSMQARWLRDALAGSTSRFDVVYFHHPPYSSDSTHGSTAFMQWPFKEWGAEVVISGHAHVYERIERDGLTYLVNGLGGASRYDFGRAVAGSAVRYRDDWGAQKVTATPSGMTFEFYNTSGTLIDSARVTDGPQ
jgi:predicted phosphodiesterase